MFLKCSTRKKDGKEHRSWSVVESRRYRGGKVAQRHVLYLGEINGSERLAWERAITVFDESTGATRQLALFPADRVAPAGGAAGVQVRLERPRQWGACWLADELWRALRMDDFFGARLPPNREGTDWEKVLRILTIYRLLSPGVRVAPASSMVLDDCAGRSARCGRAGRAGRHALESILATLPWREVRPQLRVKLLPQDGEVYVLAHSGAREGKERGMRKRRLKAYWKRLAELQKQALSRDGLLKKLGAAQDRAGRVATGLVQVDVSAEGRLSYSLDRAALRAVRQREGRYLLRTNLPADDPELIWRCYIQLVFVEEAFRTLKGDLGLRPIFHQKPKRIEAHLFVAFFAYCLSITLRQQLRGLAPGLMPRVVFEKLAALQMLDVIVPTTDNRELLLVRRTEPDRDVALLLDRLGRSLPPQPPPKIRAPAPHPL